MPYALIAIGFAATFAGCLSDPLRPLVPLGWALWAAGGLLIYRQGAPPARTILIVAIALRLLAFAMPPSLSDDIYRYLWDGWLTLHGENPYQYLPTDDEVAWARGQVDPSSLNSPGYHSVYPPTSQLLFTVGGCLELLRQGLGVWGIKLVLGLCELGGLLLLSRLVGPRPLLLYAWHPAVVTESWGQAHTDAAVAGLLIFVCYALSRNRGWLAVAALTLAAWAKLHPLLLLPWLFAVVGWRWWWVAAAATAAVWLPFWAPYVPGNLKESLDLYTGAFEFNAGPYEFFAWLGDIVLGGSGLLGGGGDSGKVVALLLQCLLLGILPCLYAIGCRRQWGFPKAAYLTYALVLLTTATIHPWYPLPLLALIALRQKPSWHWQFLALGLSISYLFYTHGLAPYYLGMIVAWGGWLVLLMRDSPILKKRRKSIDSAGIKTDTLAPMPSHREGE